MGESRMGKKDFDVIMEKMNSIHKDIGDMKTTIAVTNACVSNMKEWLEKTEKDVKSNGERIGDCEKELAGQKTFFSLLSMGIAALVSGLMRLIFK